MRKVTLHYIGQLKAAAGVAEEALDLPEDGTLRAVVDEICTSHGEAMREQLIGRDGNPTDSVVFLVDGRQSSDFDAPLPSGSGVTVIALSPMIGG